MNNNNQHPYILEFSNVEDANNVDLALYRFERFSEGKNVYIFVKRQKELICQKCGNKRK